MSETARDPQTGADFVPGFDAALKGRQAECDGGAPIPGTRHAGRQEFAGTLTGHYRDYGKYAWRWVLLAELTKKPDNYGFAAVWCDLDSVYMAD
ncbi:MAG: hypothetical protein KUL75_01070 [Sterolibacterium sp.]|nr:hypothetical protein [Sterolibacterium sp.]